MSKQIPDKPSSRWRFGDDDELIPLRDHRRPGGRAKPTSIRAGDAQDVENTRVARLLRRDPRFTSGGTIALIDGRRVEFITFASLPTKAMPIVVKFRDPAHPGRKKVFNLAAEKFLKLMEDPPCRPE